MVTATIHSNQEAAILNFSRFLFVPCLLPTLTASEVICDNNQGFVGVETLHDNTSVTLWAKIRHELLLVTISLTYSLTNLRATAGAEGLFVLRRGERTKLATQSAQENGRRFFNYTNEWNRGDIRARHDAGYCYRLP